ncbi:tetratricopeptide repeat protein [Shewanella donghaensis]|uniref:tetratricopeptide repeat protein n=1 Tax=Shewanella donghaensis TaxID=238836 RepID=UPI001182D50D|nr:tetratricopeptide repeat protein [Shewanella donghaensis]
MSVINKVLKDLDKRQQSVGNVETQRQGFISPEVQFQSAVQPSSTSQSSNKGVIVAIVMLLAMSILGYMLYRQAQQLHDMQPLAENQIDADIPARENVELGRITEGVTTESIEVNNAASAEASIETVDNADLVAAFDKAANEKQIDNFDGTDVQSEVVVAKSTKPDNSVLSEPETKIVAVTGEDVEVNRDKKSDKESSVQVRYEQTTRSSSFDTDVKTTSAKKYTDVKVSNKQPATVTNANEKGHMAVKEVMLTNEQLAQKKFNAAETAEQKQKIDQAIKNYYEALVLQPSMHQARKQLAALYYSVNNLGRAQQILAQGVNLFPEEVELVVLKAKVENAAFNADKALNTLNAIDDNSEWARDKWILQSDIAQKNGQFEIAESAYRSLLTLEPSQARWWMGLAYALDSQQQYSQAADAYRKAMSYRGLSTGAMTYIEQRLIQLGGSQ